MTEYCGYVYTQTGLTILTDLTSQINLFRKKKKELTNQFLTGMIIVLTSLNFFFLIEFTFFWLDNLT